MTYKRSKQNFFVNLGVVCAGAMLAFAFSPFEFSILPFFSCVFLLLSWISVTPRQAAWRGFLFGLGQFGAGVTWVYISIQVYGQAPPLLAGLITLFFITYLALFPAVQGYSLNYFFPQNNTKKLIFVYPTSWVFAELLRSWLFTGFPWLLLGYSQTNSYLNGYAALFGVYGITFIIAFCSALIVTLFLHRNSPRKCFFYLTLIMIIWIGGFILHNIPWTKKVGEPLRTTIIQGNIQQELKWQPEQFTKTFKLYLDYTYKNLHSDLIVWPEAAITLPLHYVNGDLTALAKVAHEHGIGIITGVPIMQSKAAYNGIVALGDSNGLYYKRHLVPFGEYTPLKIIFKAIIGFFNIPMSNFLPGPRWQPGLNFRQIAVAPYICYEVAYPLEVLTFLPHANILLTLTDDSWFGKSIASAQHLQIAQMRSLETGRPMIFSSNTGITGVINHEGRLLKTVPPFQEQVLTALIQPMQGSTPWVRWKIYPQLFLMIFLLALSWRGRKLPSSGPSGHLLPLAGEGD